MGVVDTIMVGPLGPAAIAAAGVGTSLHMAFAIFGMGLLLGLDTLVSQAYGARQIDRMPSLADSRRRAGAAPGDAGHAGLLCAVLVDSSAGLSPRSPAAARVVLCRHHLEHAVPAALRGVSPLPAGHPPRRAGDVRAGHGEPRQRRAATGRSSTGTAGFPALGVAGSAWATFVSRVYMAAVLLIAIVVHDRWRLPPTSVRRCFERASLRRLIDAGLPGGVNRGARSGRLRGGDGAGRATGAGLCRLAPDALNIAAVSFMVPLGLASAGAVRVGHAVGAGSHPRRAAAAGWTAILLGVAFTLLAALAFLAMLPAPDRPLHTRRSSARARLDAALRRRGLPAVRRASEA